MKLRFWVLALSVAGCMLVSQPLYSQGRTTSGRNNHRTTGSVSARPATNRNTSARPAGTATMRPGNGASMQARPATSATVRPTGNTTNNHRPGNTGTTGVRPGNNGTNNRPTGGNSSTVRPGYPGNNNRPGTVHPGVNNRPGGNSHITRPGATHWGGNSVQRPGNTASFRPNYRPMRPGGGYWGAPPINRYRPAFLLPPPPRRYTTVRVGIPTIGSVLGLTFGSLIDAGINTLLGGGYNIIGYANNALYLSDVTQLGYMWPEVTVYYNNGLMANTQFQYWTPTSSMSRFNLVYNQLCNLYGAPVDDSYVNGMRTVSWWGGGNTGYVTLQYGYGNSASGLANYYTTLTYGQ